MKSVILLFLTSVSCLANSFTIELENDVFYHADQNYTHGTKLTYEHNNLSYSLAQNMYTPNDISVSSPITNQRAYAGILYFGVEQSKQYKHIFQELEGNIGIIGDYSLAGDTQILVHKWTDSQRPMGWKYQVDDDLLLQLNSRFHYNIYGNSLLNARIYECNELGTIFGNIGVGAHIALGYNVPKIIKKPMISKVKKYSIYVFGDIETRAILWNNILNSDYTDVEATSHVEDIQCGIGGLFKNIELKYTYTHRNKEYENQSRNAKFGSLTIKFNF